MKIETPRLKLVAFTQKHIDAIVSGNLQKLSLLLNAEVHTHWQAFAGSEAAADYFYTMIQDQNDDDRFGGYFIIFKADQNLIGTCGFKGKQTHPASVEIGYEIQSEYQRLGLATEAAKALSDFAFAEGAQKVTAQTLPDGLASHRVLEKCGFHKSGEAHDAEHGLLWNWALFIDPAPITH